MYKSAYTYCKPLYDVFLADIRTAQMQEIIDFAKIGAPTRARIQSMLKLMFRFAMKNDYIKKDYAQYLKRPAVEVKSERRPFTDDEIKRMWALSEEHSAKILLIMMYTGWRPSELVPMRFGKEIDIKERTMTGGIKTQAGKNRVVPFCKKIEPLVHYFYDKGYAGISVDQTGAILTYDGLYRILKSFLDANGFNHIPYECRHTFATMLDNKNTNVKIKKMLMGHASTDVTEKVYTHKTIEQLKSAVDAL
jgi:integrase